MKYNVIGTYKYKDLERFTYAQLEADEIAIEKYPLILFDPFETEFDHHGIAVLDGAVNPIIVEEVNGDYSLTAEILKDERGKYTRVKPLCIIKAQGQLFRIPYLNGIKDNGFVIKINAKHISYDAAEIFNEDRRVNNQNIYETLSRLLEADTRGKYSIGVTDVTTTASANFIMENFIESLFNKVLPRWNGEIIRDNFKFTVKNRIGKYKPDLFIRYSKNSDSIERQVDYSQLCTNIIPVGKNGITIEEINRGRKNIESNKINDYPLIYTKKVKFDDAETPEQLIDLAVDYLNKYDTPLITIKVSLIDLEENSEYDNLKNSIRMNLGDTVTIYDDDLGIDEEQRVISIETDAVTGIKLKITLGEFAPSFADSISDLEGKTDDITNKISESIQTSDDIKNQVVNNTKEIEDLKSITENLNKDITATNNEIGQLPALETEFKENLVGAINEVFNKLNDFTCEGDGGGESSGNVSLLDCVTSLPDEASNGKVLIDVSGPLPLLCTFYNGSWYGQGFNKIGVSKGFLTAEEIALFTSDGAKVEVVQDTSISDFNSRVKVNTNGLVSTTLTISGKFTTGRGVIRMPWKISSETNCDFGYIYIDGVEVINGSGEMSGTYYKLVEEGEHTLKISYKTDSSVSRGEDAISIWGIEYYK